MAHFVRLIQLLFKLGALLLFDVNQFTVVFCVAEFERDVLEVQVYGDQPFDEEGPSTASNSRH